MENYKYLINNFFSYFDITIADKLKEQKNILSPHFYSISYRVENVLRSRNNGLVIRFSFDENNTHLKSSISCSYEDSALAVLKLDGAILREQIALGLNCMAFLDRQKIRHYCPLIEISAIMDKTSKKTSFNISSHTINIYISNDKTDRVNLLSHVNNLIEKELSGLDIDTRNLELKDKLDLLAMVRI